jgi:tetrahydromethanopterin S-methyltransferase subunit F
MGNSSMQDADSNTQEQDAQRWRFGTTYEPNHYELFTLDETASAWQIRRAYLGGPSTWPAGPWRWVFFHNQRLVERLGERCHEAYHVLSDPALRVAYDTEQSYTRDHLARRIGRKGATWGVVWAIVFAIVGLLLATDHDNISRMVGSAFAPGYHEVRQRVKESEGSASYYKSTFYSSNDRWQSTLNSGFTMGVIPGLLAATVGVGGGILLNRAAGKIIVAVRFAKYRDTWARSLIWLFTISVPAAAIIQILRYGVGATTIRP